MMAEYVWWRRWLRGGLVKWIARRGSACQNRTWPSDGHRVDYLTEHEWPACPYVYTLLVSGS